MIRPEELRIGNLVKIRNQIVIVQSMSYCGFIQYKHDKDSVPVYGEPHEEFEPIELTEEKLIEFGFDDSEYRNGYIGKDFGSKTILQFVLTKPKFMGEWQEYYAFELGNNRFVPVKSVHRLQNLWYEITNEELTITKPK